MSSGRRPATRAWVLHPWLIAAYPVLFLYAHNTLYVEAGAALRVLPLSLAAATLLFLLLRLVLKDSVRAGILTTAFSVLFFAYGAVADFAVARGWLGEGALLALWAGLALVATVTVWRSREWPAANRGLNLIAGLMVLMPLAQIGYFALERLGEPRHAGGADAEPGTAGAARGRPQRDIYFIVLDEYQRQDHLLEAYGFDNSGFVGALRERGFYVAPAAVSNYTKTLLSLAATLNMRYLEPVLSSGSVRQIARRLQRMIEDHQVGRLLKARGYTCIHVSSGKHPTATSEVADVVYDFAPSGVQRFGADAERQRVRHDEREFMMLVFATTLAGRLMPQPAQELMVANPDVPYTWFAPERTLASFDLVASIPRMEAATFTFFHVIKPHAPYMFDRHGNVLAKPPGWTWKDGREDKAAMLDQLIFLNRLVLELVDEILERSETTPIIVIQSDHGENLAEQDLEKKTHILSAFLLPDGGAERLYASISPVNTFRLILNHYFGERLEVLPDRSAVSVGDGFVEVTARRPAAGGAADQAAVSK